MFEHALSLSVADAIADATLEKGRAEGFQPLTVAVLDDGGRLKVLKRADGSSVLRPEIAMGKAFGALSLGMGGRELARRSQKMPGFMNALSDLAGGLAVPVPGGVLVKSAEGRILGAVGVTGDLSDNDEICAVHAIQAAGLVADTGDPA
ncbi:GlcG/HbpS family heme-binding protein [Roseospira navarrensis]|uniref:Heme-binding protein n=1 Tax=Roseospira navarrensis TaxID=140058 RepID=A0A7X1ZDN2_9PROT|nr:heme-binding protein [Roseospira navarrensis]MQX36628.1 heme-binding protein [Roseospira navarrensis]